MPKLFSSDFIVKILLSRGFFFVSQKRKSYTRKQLVQRIEEAEARVRAGEFTTQEELEAEAKHW